MDLVRQTAVASLAAQVVIGAITSAGFFVTVDDPRTRADLNVILAFEVASQAVEFLWYLAVLTTARRITTWTRYLDWVLSTPVMLVSLGLFFRHRAARDIFGLFDTYEIYVSLAFNWVMLAFGFGMERTTVVHPAVGLLGGGAALVGSFTLLARTLDSSDVLSNALFGATYGVWALYGVAAAFDDIPKNVMYNAIDVVSKNGYGLFLFVYALTR